MKEQRSNRDRRRFTYTEFYPERRKAERRKK